MTGKDYIDENGVVYPIYRRLYRGTTDTTVGTNTIALNLDDPLRHLIDMKVIINTNSNQDVFAPVCIATGRTQFAFVTRAVGSKDTPTGAETGRPYTAILEYTL